MLALPLGLYLSQRQQTVRSRASELEVSPSPTAIVLDGDIDRNGCVDMRDYDEWLRKYPNPAENPSAFDEYKGWLQKFNAGSNICPSSTP